MGQSSGRRNPAATSFTGISANSEAVLDNHPYERITVYPSDSSLPGDEQSYRFLAESGNLNFRRSFLTWVNLVFILIVYPAIATIGVGDDPLSVLKDMSQGLLIIGLVITVFIQWSVFLINYGGVYTEGTGLAGVGFKRIRGVDFAWAGAFLLLANLILSGLAWLLARIGLPMPGEIGLLIPTDPLGKVVWVVVSVTAGICEETAFRGYLMTRLRIIGRFRSWLVPVIISAVVFGICHAYQGLPGFILLTVYGAMFSLLYIRTGSLWPCIIAHFFQDFGALFFPQ